MDLVGRTELKICVDASLKTFRDKRVFTCSGAICINNDREDYYILQDSTNNRGELMAVYQGIMLAIDEIRRNPTMYGKVSIFSDSQFAVCGITEWFHTWIKNRNKNGIMYNSSGEPVKNQNMFMMIVSLCVSNRLIVHFYNNLGHVDITSNRQLIKATDYFNKINKDNKSIDEIRIISMYNNEIDYKSRKLLNSINPSKYPRIKYDNNPVSSMRYYIDPKYTRYIK